MGIPDQIFPETDGRWLKEDTVIWRYVPLRTLFFYLNGLVFIPSVAKLQTDDPFEGKFYEEIAWFNQAFAGFYGGEGKEIRDWIHRELFSDWDRLGLDLNKSQPNVEAGVRRRHYFDFIRKTRFAWCWFGSSRESAAMWSVYGNQGVAIQTTVGRLMKLLGDTGLKFIFGRLTYVDYQAGRSVEFNPEREEDYRLLLRPFFLKRREYESEKEVRFVTAASERNERGGILLRNLDAKDWISAVRLWPRLTVEEERCLCCAIEKFLPGVDCARSNLFSGADGIEGDYEKLISDLEQTADSQWHSREDGIPPKLKEVWQLEFLC